MILPGTFGIPTRRGVARPGTGIEDHSIEDQALSAGRGVGR
jgi:hypothetical protein